MRNPGWAVLVVGMGLLATTVTMSAEEKTDDIAKKAVENFFTVLKSKKVDEMMKIVDVPFYWLSEPRPIVWKTTADLKEAFHGFMTETPGLAKAEMTIQDTLTLDKYVDSTGKKLSAEDEKQLTELLGKEHRIYRTRMKIGENAVTLSFGVRVKDKKGTVVGVFR